MTGVLYTTSGHDGCFALARMAGGTGLGFAWIRRFGAFVSGVGGGSGGGVLGRVFWGSGVEKGWDEALGGVGR